MTECRAHTGPIWKMDGEICVCVKPVGHGDDHECSCGTWFVDSVAKRDS